MKYKVNIGLLDCEGFDHYTCIVVEASSQEEAERQGNEEIAAQVGGFFVWGSIGTIVPIDP